MWAGPHHSHHRYRYGTVYLYNLLGIADPKFNDLILVPGSGSKKLKRRKNLKIFPINVLTDLERLENGSITVFLILTFALPAQVFSQLPVLFSAFLPPGSGSASSMRIQEVYDDSSLDPKHNSNNGFISLPRHQHLSATPPSPPFPRK